jgi:hypothetical protein
MFDEVWLSRDLLRLSNLCEPFIREQELHKISFSTLQLRKVSANASIGVFTAAMN